MPTTENISEKNASDNNPATADVVQKQHIALREYQRKILQETHTQLKENKRALIVSPTGSGKTVLASYVLDSATRNDGTAWFICHRVELVTGTSNTLTKFGIEHGTIARGARKISNHKLHVCSIDTLKNRLDKLKAPALAIIDECHHSGAKGWAMVIKWLTDNGTRIIGLSATPSRLDGKGLDEYFDVIVPGPTVKWLIEEGFLSQYRIYGPHTPDMKNVRKAMGDFDITGTAEAMDKPKITGDAISHWLKYAKDMRTVVFGVTVEHSMHISAAFNAAGIPSAHLDGSTDKEIRRKIIKQFADGEIVVLCNVGLFSEGFDLSAIAQTDVTIDAVLDMAPTMSLSNYLQRGGRMLRPAPGKIGVYLDHAGNNKRHGFFDDEREWTLEGRQKGKKAAVQVQPPKTCPACFQQHKHPGPEVCDCGEELRKKNEREIEIAEGDLKQIDRNAVRILQEKQAENLRKKREQAQAKTLDELIALGKARGYKNPRYWAESVMKNRRGSYGSAATQLPVIKKPQIDYDELEALANLLS